MLLSSNSPRQGCYYCLEFAPRGLSSAITLQRFREMKGGASLAQYDKKNNKIAAYKPVNGTFALNNRRKIYVG